MWQGGRREPGGNGIVGAVGVLVRRTWPAGSMHPLMDKQGKEISPGHVARKPGRALKLRWGSLKTSMLSPHPRWTEVHAPRGGQDSGLGKMCSGDSRSQARAQDVRATAAVQLLGQHPGGPVTGRDTRARDSQVSPQAHDQCGAPSTAPHGHSGWEK